MARKVPNLEIEGAELIFKNFCGRPGKFTPEGQRSFAVVIPPENVDALVAQGWNVKPLKPLDEGDELRYILTVKVTYDVVVPQVFLISESGNTPMTEETIGLLDSSDILAADLVINPYYWEMAGNSGLSAYLKKAYITIQEDSFARKYGI